MNNKGLIGRFLKEAIDLLFPRRCPICDDILPYKSNGVCKECKDKVVFIEDPFCLKCGKALSEPKEYCDDCSKRNHRFIQGVSVFDYGSVSDSLFRFKNKGRIEYAEYYAKAIVHRRGRWLKHINPDAFIPVPIHSSKMKKRGYNQAEILSKELTRLTGIPTNTSLVMRSHKTSPLKNLSLKERQNNLKNAFKVNDNDVKLKTIVIIDDIYTTGSTMDEISQSILSKFDCKIYFLTLTVGRGI